MGGRSVTWWRRGSPRSSPRRSGPWHWRHASGSTSTVALTRSTGTSGRQWPEWPGCPPRRRRLFRRWPRSRGLPAKPSDEGGFDVVVEFCSRSVSLRCNLAIRSAYSAITLRNRSFSRRSRSISSACASRSSACASRRSATLYTVRLSRDRRRPPELLPGGGRHPSEQGRQVNMM